jgi:hypothetical protein
MRQTQPKHFKFDFETSVVDPDWSVGRLYRCDLVFANLGGNYDLIQELWVR